MANIRTVDILGVIIIVLLYLFLTGAFFSNMTWSALIGAGAVLTLMGILSWF